MARLKNPKPVPPLEDVEIPLLCGPPRGEEWPADDMAELEAGWRADRDRIMEGARRPPGLAAAGWWAFEAREPMPSDKGEAAVRLAELLGGHTAALGWRCLRRLSTVPNGSKS